MELPTYTTVNQEAFEAPHAFLYKSFKLTSVARDDATIEANVNPAFVLSSFDLDFQVLDCGSRRDGVQWHVNNGGNSTECGSTSACPETLPFCPTRFVKMYMCIDQTGKKDVW